MKLLNKTLQALLPFVLCSASFAQSNNPKPAVFADQPQEINLSAQTLSSKFSAAKGDQVSFQLSPQFLFSGSVMSNEAKYSNLRTMLVRSSTNEKTVFQITRITNEDQTFTYTGRIVNNDAADGFEIKNNNGNYILRKFKTNDVLDPCYQ